MQSRISMAAVLLGCGVPVLAQHNPSHGVASQSMFDLIGLACAAAPDSAEFRTFGRMFVIAPPPRVPESVLVQVAEAMRESRAPVDGDGHPTVPLASDSVAAGFIFLGQFVDHDLTFDVLSQLGEEADPSRIANFRTPRLDLDSVYLAGPNASPFLYEHGRFGFLRTGNAQNPDDLPRNEEGVALIGDPRNDENGIVSQLHLAFLRFHNAVLSDVARGRIHEGRRAGENDFEFARRLVRWHYQWLIRHEFLPAVVDAAVLAEAEQALQSPHANVCNGAPIMLVEFAVAAYRFGHSQVRGRYRIAPGRDGVDLFAPPADALTSFAPLPMANRVDLSLFFAVDGSRPQMAQRIDTFLTDEVFELPFERDAKLQSLAFRNLHRGTNTFRLPTGEQVLAALDSTATPLPPHPAIDAAGLSGKTPLWFYCLQEAEQNGGKLGKVGGTIVAVTILRILYTDPTSYLYRPLPVEAAGQGPVRATPGAAQRSVPAAVATDWRPVLGRPGPGVAAPGFTIADLLRCAEAGR